MKCNASAERERERSSFAHLPAVDRPIALLRLGRERLPQQQRQLADVPKCQRIGEAGVHPIQLRNAGRLPSGREQRENEQARAPKLSPCLIMSENERRSSAGAGSC